MKTIFGTTIAAAAIGVALFATAAPAAAADIRCNSSVGGYNYCRTSTAGGVILRYQHSSHVCYQNDTWGYDGGGIWVANGCSATFRTGRRDNDDTAAKVGLGILALGVIGALASNDDDDGYGDSPPPPPQGYPPYDPNYPPQNGGYPQQGYPGNDDGYGDAYTITCESKNNKNRFCPAEIRNYAQLVHQRSRSACRFNKTWGYDRRGVWVKKGCRGDFAIY